MYNDTRLGELISFLETMDPKAQIKGGFGAPHSDRGSYDELAFDPKIEATIGDMLFYAKSAVGATYEGWKGGEYTMDLNTPVYIGESGSCGEPITPTHFKYWKLTSGVWC